MPTPTSPLRRTVRRVATTVAGTLVVAAGVAMLVLPGPGFVTIALGLSILGREHEWAAALERRARTRIATTLRRARHSRPGGAGHHPGAATTANACADRPDGAVHHVGRPHQLGPPAQPPGTAWDHAA